MIKDSGARKQFPSGAVRDISKGKGRCDLLPLGEVAELLGSPCLSYIALFQNDPAPQHLQTAMVEFIAESAFPDAWTAVLEVSVHFEEGCEKYGEDNWQKGIPVKHYIDSGVRHYLKHLRGDDDERHDRAFLWNLLCAMWTTRNMPELVRGMPELVGE